MTKTTKQAEAAVNQAQKVVLEARDLLGQWRARLADAQGAVVRVESESGEALLNDPEKAAAWPAELREARDAVTVSERAVAAQEPCVGAAERAWCRAQADLFEVDVLVPARKRLDEHQARTAELLAALEAHDGPYVPRHELAMARRDLGFLTEGTQVQVPKSRVLQMDVTRAEAQHQVLVAMAEGDDPGNLSADGCPEAVRPGGLVPAPVFRRQEQQLRELVRELESLPSVLEVELSDLEQRNIAGLVPGEVVVAARARHAQRLEELPDELTDARRRLAEVVGRPLVGSAA